MTPDNKSGRWHLLVWASPLAGFLASFAFFLTAYQYHLMRREQINLFLYDWDYISTTYRGSGWLARLVSDFLEQFFGIPVIGPLIVALLITATAMVTFRICRRFLNIRISFLISAAIFVWSFLRETENRFCTQYTVAVLGFLILISCTCTFRRTWVKALAAAISVVAGIWAFGSPVHQYYGRIIGKPEFKYERVIALDVETSRENWDKVLKLSRKDIWINEASYFYNLANAMKGGLGQNLLKHSQNYTGSLFLWVTDKVSDFTSSISGEVWYHLGDMTLAEQSMIVAMQASPKHTGARFLKRMAEINLISGEYGAAQKYLNILSKTLFYRKWALSMIPDRQDAQTAAWLEARRKDLPDTDLISDRNDIRPILLKLLEANPANTRAREYLLCFDLMSLDLDSFMEDCTPEMMASDIYQEATLIWLNIENGNDISDINVRDYGVSEDVESRLYRFYKAPERYRSTYWYFFSRNMQ